MNRWIVGAFLLVMTTACVPIWERQVPALSGAVYRNGVPVQGARVHLLNTSYGGAQGRLSCPDSNDVRVTMPDGTFTFPTDRGLGFWPMLGDGGPSWQMCIQTPEGWYSGYWTWQWGRVSKRLHLDCNLASGEPDDGRVNPDKILCRPVTHNNCMQRSGSP